jgi:hypothetical protein
VLVHFVVPFRDRNFAYPLLKWRDRLRKDGMDVVVRNRPCTSKAGRADVVFLTSYFYRSFYPNNDSFFDQSRPRILEDIQTQKGFGSRVVYYDLTAGGSTRQLWPIRYVDVLLKRQLLRDKMAYANVDTPHRRNPWVPDDNSVGEVCDAKDLPRLQLGWSLGYSDYRTTSRWLIRLKYQSFEEPRLTPPHDARQLLASFRGRSEGSRALQRNGLVALLASRDDPRLVTGEFLSRRRYLEELRHCQTVISPFGYGEICYRDFEAFVVGAALIKPSVEHLTTFPEIFIPGETYLPCRWDLSDLLEMLDNIDKGRVNALSIAQRGQEMFIERHLNYSNFAAHFKKILQQAAA